MDEELSSAITPFSEGHFSFWVLLISGFLSCGRECSPIGLFVLIIFPYANVVLFNCSEASDEHREERGEDKLIIDSWAIFLEAIAIT